MTPIHFILLNGAPGSGKNTFGAHLQQLFSATPISIEHGFGSISQYSLAAPLKLALGYMMGLKVNEIEALKDRPIPDTNTTIRQLLINISETVIKPALGTDWWAQRVIQSACKLSDAMSGSYHIAIITDLGFESEAETFEAFIAEQPDVPHTVTFVQMLREGHTFANDSRHAIQATDKRVINYVENHNLLQLRAAAEDFVADFVKNVMGAHKDENNH